MYVSYVNTVAKACLFAGVFSQLSIFTATPYRPDGGCRNHMEVAHSYCNKLIILCMLWQQQKVQFSNLVSVADKCIPNVDQIKGQLKVSVKLYRCFHDRGVMEF